MNKWNYNIVATGRAFLVVLFTIIGNRLDAQVATGRNFQDFFGKEAKQVARKIYDAGKSGNITCYVSDSLQSSYSVDEVRKQGAYLRVLENTEDTDTAFYVLFDPDSMVPDVSLIYSVSKEDKGIVMKPKGIGIFYNERFPPGLIYQVPLFYVAYDEVIQKVLNIGEAKFLENYAVYKIFEQATLTGLGREPNLTNAWYNYTEIGVFKSGTFTSEISLGKYIYETLESRLFTSNIPILDSKGIQMPKDDFNKKHSIAIITQVQDPTNPVNLIDTMYWEHPKSFDSLSFEFVKGTKKIVVHHRVDKSWKYERYFIRFEDLKGSIPEDIYSWLDVFYKEYFHP